MIHDFIALDFETACNCKPRRVCSMGISYVRDGKLIFCTNYYIDPQVEISPMCAKVHGITDEMVQGCPDFSFAWGQLSSLLRESPVLVIHNAAFDYTVLREELELLGEEIPENLFVYDTMRLAKSRLELEKYTLPALCKHYRVPVLSHHTSSDDSEMCARAFLKLQEEFGDFSGCEYRIVGSSSKTKEKDRGCENRSSRAEQYYNYSHGTPVYIIPDVEYDSPEELTFKEKSFVLTGKIGVLNNNEMSVAIERSVAREVIEEQGGVVKGSVSKNIDYLVVGIEDSNLVKDKNGGKSRKILDAEELRANGGAIKLISAKDFILRLLKDGQLIQ